MAIHCISFAIKLKAYCTCQIPILYNVCKMIWSHTVLTPNTGTGLPEHASVLTQIRLLLGAVWSGPAVFAIQHIATYLKISFAEILW